MQVAERQARLTALRVFRRASLKDWRVSIDHSSDVFWCKGVYTLGKEKILYINSRYLEVYGHHHEVVEYKIIHEIIRLEEYLEELRLERMMKFEGKRRNDQVYIENTLHRKKHLFYPF